VSTSIQFDIYARDHASRTFDSVGDSADRSGSSVGGMSSKLKSFAKAGALAGVAAAGFAVKIGIDAVGNASDLNETLSKSSVIFGKNAGAMEAWAEKADKAMGMSKQAALESAAGFGDMFSQIGFTGDRAAKMSKQVVQMATDFGSFNNLPTAEVADMISGAFRGEYDSLQRVIPNISAARVQTEALNMTHKESVEDLTAAEKATAALAIMQQDGARAAGDFARTSGGLANQQKILKAQLDNASASLGQKLLPFAVTAVTFINDKMIPGVARLWSWLGEKLGPVFEKIGNFIQNDLIPAVRPLVEKWFTGFSGVIDKVKGSGDDLAPTIALLKGALKGIWFVLENAVFPALTKWYSVYWPAVAKGFELVIKFIGIMSRQAIWMWNNAWQPVLTNLIKFTGMAMDQFGQMLQIIGKAPKMGWVGDLGDELRSAAGKADGLASSMKKIDMSPETKYINIVVHTTRTGPGGTGGEYGVPQSSGRTGGGAAPRPAGMAPRSGGSNMERLLSDQNDLLREVIRNQRAGVNAGQGSYLLGADF